MLNINAFKKKYDEQKQIKKSTKQVFNKPVTVKEDKKDDSITLEEIDNYSILDDDD